MTFQRVATYITGGLSRRLTLFTGADPSSSSTRRAIQVAIHPQQPLNTGGNLRDRSAASFLVVRHTLHLATSNTRAGANPSIIAVGITPSLAVPLSKPIQVAGILHRLANRFVGPSSIQVMT